MKVQTYYKRLVIPRYESELKILGKWQAKTRTLKDAAAFDTAMNLLREKIREGNRIVCA